MVLAACAVSKGCALPRVGAGGEPQLVLCHALGLPQEMQDSSFPVALRLLEEHARAEAAACGSLMCQAQQEPCSSGQRLTSAVLAQVQGGSSAAVHRAVHAQNHRSSKGFGYCTLMCCRYAAMLGRVMSETQQGRDPGR